MNNAQVNQLIELGNITQGKFKKIIRKQYQSINLELFDPTEDEIINGLFSRSFRFFSSYLMHPSYYAGDVGMMLMRSLLETNIYLLYLLKKAKKELYLEFKKYGIGQAKKFKAKLIEYTNNGILKREDQPEWFIDYLNSDVDKEIWDELVNIELKNFDNTRELAIEADLKYEYDTLYEPASSIVHGQFNALSMFYLKSCKNPLHRLHLIPNFELPLLDIKFISMATTEFFRSYDAWTKHYKLEDELTPEFGKYSKKLSKILKKPKEK